MLQISQRPLRAASLLGDRVKAIADAFADGIRRWWAPHINTIGEPNITGVDLWLATGNYSCTGYTAPQAATGTAPAVQETLTIHLVNPEDLSHAFASEISRFSCAAYESLLDAAPPAAVSKSLGWAVVRHYYAAFYAAHCIMRIAGSSLTFVSSETIRKVNGLASAYLGVQPPLKSGIHLVRFDRSDPKLVTITKVSSGAGGSHEDLWRVFLTIAKETETEIIRTMGRSSAGPDGAVQLLTDFRAYFRETAWASKLRNGVNYRQEYGVWFPWDRRNKDSQKLAARMQLWKPLATDGLQLTEARDELVKLAEVCNVLVHLMTIALKDIAKRSQSSKGCFVDRRPFRYLKTRNILLEPSP